MRLPSFVACSLVLVGLLPSVVSAQPHTSVVNLRGPTTQASWQIVSAAGCRQDVTMSVNSSRWLIVDTSSHSVIKETDKSSLQVVINQWDGPGCELVTISNLIDNLSAAQFIRNGASSAMLNVDHIVLSDPVIGKYVIDAHLNWKGVGPMSVTEQNERFCNEGVCFFSKGVDQNRSANLTGTVTATVSPLFGSTFTADYSPSAGTQLAARLENTVSGTITQF